MKILITPNYTKKGTNEALEKLKEIISASGSEYKVVDLSRYDTADKFADYGADLLIFIGGDGTMLRSGKIALGLNIPILGIHTGTIGYRVGVKIEDMLGKIKEVLSGNYNIEECLILKTTLEGKTQVAINDIVLYAESINHFSVYKDENLIFETRSSGIIFSTAIGSTGITKSAGGAVMQNDIKAFEITSICPYSGDVSSLIVPSNGVYTISFNDSVRYSIDGSPQQTTWEDIVITNNEESLKLIRK